MELRFPVDEAALAGYLLVLVRTSAWVFTCPPFGTKMVPSTVKVGFAAALTIAAGPKLAGSAVPLEAGPMLVASVLQAGAGFALGFLGVMLFSAAQAAGHMIDLFGGFSTAQLFDPQTGNQASVFGRFYQLMFTVLLFSIDGHLLLVRGLMTSIEAAPLTSLDMTSIGQAFTSGLGLFFLSAIEIAAPLLAALFLADVALGLLSRAAPDMNVFMLGMPLKIMLTLSLAALALPLLPEAVSGLTDTVVRTGMRFFG